MKMLFNKMYDVDTKQTVGITKRNKMILVIKKLVIAESLPPHVGLFGSSDKLYLWVTSKTSWIAS